jgi:hypothetical protein
MDDACDAMHAQMSTPRLIMWPVSAACACYCRSGTAIAAAERHQAPLRELSTSYAIPVARAYTVW